MAPSRYVTVKLPIDIGMTELGAKLDLLMEFVAKSHELLIKRLGDLETMVYTNAEDLRKDVNTSLNDLADQWDSQVEDLKADLAKALADDDGVDADAEERVNAAVAATLDKFSDLPAAIRAIGADRDNPVPDAPAPSEGGTDGGTEGGDSGAPLDQGQDTGSTGGQTSGETEPEVSIDSPPPDPAIETPADRLNP